MIGESQRPSASALAGRDRAHCRGRDGGLLEPEEHKRLHGRARLDRRTARPDGSHDPLQMINLGAPLEVALEDASRARSAGCLRRDSPANIVGVHRVKDPHPVSMTQAERRPSIAAPQPFVRVPAKLPGDQVIARLHNAHTRPPSLTTPPARYSVSSSHSRRPDRVPRSRGLHIVTNSPRHLRSPAGECGLRCRRFAIIGVSRTASSTARTPAIDCRRILALLTSPVHQDRFIATAQLGITLPSLGLDGGETRWPAGSSETRAVADEPVIAAHTLASVLAIAGLTYSTSLLARCCRRRRCRTPRTARVCWPMLDARCVLSAGRALNGAGNLFLQAVEPAARGRQ